MFIAFIFSYSFYTVRLRNFAHVTLNICSLS